MLEHGGRIRLASQKYGIPPADWIDLSTGINPQSWTVPDVPSAVWQRLPEVNDGLEDAARAYYGTDLLLPTAGSQAAILTLPLLRAPSLVAISSLTYNEYAAAWQRHGHQVLSLDETMLLEWADGVDVLVLCNPNNPTCRAVKRDTILRVAQSMSRRGAWLVVDETFVDTHPELSVIDIVGSPGLIVLRSMSKFFGLAGARVGFVAAWKDLLIQLNDYLGPWTISGPARYLATQALRDVDWCKQATLNLNVASLRLAKLLTDCSLSPIRSTDFYVWLKHEQAEELHESLARKGILTRLFKNASGIRFGLPGKEQEWQRLALALSEWEQHMNAPLIMSDEPIIVDEEETVLLTNMPLLLYSNTAPHTVHS